jgi:hypothetical protein
MKDFRLKIKLIAIWLLFSAKFFGQLSVLHERPYLFDIGTESSDVNEFAVKLLPGDIYNDSLKYGFDGKYNSYIKNDLRLNSTRDELLYDGVEGQNLSFKLLLPKGEWFLTFWVEVGFEDIPSTELSINGKKQNIIWHQLKESAEGRDTPSKNYRVIHTKIISDGNGFSFSLKNGQNQIQLSAFSFCPLPIIKNDIDEKFINIIKKAGNYRSKVILDELEVSLKNHLRENPEDPFLFYWHQQVSLLAEAERYLMTQGWEWARQLMEQSIFDRMHQVLLLTDAILENQDISENPLKERAMWIRGKLSYDLVLERGGEYQRMIYKKDLKALFELYPDDENLAMLNGKRIDQKEYCDNLPQLSNAPEWALLQREAICRLKDEISWWVNKRQAPNGELGGKIGDDVEILREWKPLLFLGDSITVKGWKKITNAVLSDPKVYKGFSRNILDVEHSSEFISDSTPELILLEESDPYREVMEYTAEYFKNLWTAKNEHDRRYFKSAWYSSSKVDERPPRNRDLGYNTRTVKPLRYLAWKTRDPGYIELLEEWSNGWLYAAMKTDDGKPKGIIPAAIRYYDESINADGSSWYDPEMFWDYFKWEHGAGSKILDQLLFTYLLTGESRYIEPIDISLELISKHKDTISLSGQPAGSEKWVVYHLKRSKNFWSVVERWRILTGIGKYDALILQHGTPYAKYLITKNSEYLVNGLKELLDVIRYNVPLRTDLVLHTDRVRIPGTEYLEAMITGDGGLGNSPYFEVTWQNASEDLAILVNKSDSNLLDISIFSFANEQKRISARPWRLEPGEYSISIVGGSFNERSDINLNTAGQFVALNIPPKQMVKLKFIKK